MYKIETIIPNINDSFSIAKNEVELTKGIEILPEMLREDIENELKTAYNQFEALINKSSEMVDDKLLTKKYDEIKNRLIDLQHRLMDLNIIVGK